jgi:hypothetical protein
MEYSLQRSLVSKAIGIGPVPSLDLQFAKNKSLTAVKGPTPVLTRASTATYISANGTRQSATNNAPRFHHDDSYVGSSTDIASTIFSGRMYFAGNSADGSGATYPYFIDKANLFRLDYSSGDGAWFVNAIDQSSNAETNGYPQFNLRCLGLLVESAATNVYLNSGNAVGDLDYIYFSTAQSSYAFSFDYNDLAYTQIAYGQLVDDWVEVVPCTTPMSRKTIILPPLTTVLQVQGGAIKNIQIEQLETSSGDTTYSTSYIPTGATPVARSADVCTISSTAFSGFFNSSAGTLVAKCVGSTNPNASYLAITNGDVAVNSIHLDNDPANETSRSVYYSGGSAVAILDDEVSWRTFNRFATAYAVNDFVSCINGGTIQTDTSGALPVGLNQMVIGGDGRSSKIYWTGKCIDSIKYYNKRLSNSIVKSLTI